MTQTFMRGLPLRRETKRRLLRTLAARVRRTHRSRHTPASRILPGPVRRWVARLLAAAVPKNASGNNASVR